MSVGVIKALTRRIETRLGGGKHAALAAGVSPGVWSQYAHDDHGDITLPFHRLLTVANPAERAAFGELLDGSGTAPKADLLTDASEVVEGAAALFGEIRRAMADDTLSISEKRRIRRLAVDLKAELDDVIKGADE